MEASECLDESKDEWMAWVASVVGYFDPRTDEAKRVRRVAWGWIGACLVIFTVWLALIM